MYDDNGEQAAWFTWNTVMIAHRRSSKFLRPHALVPTSAGSQNLQPKRCIPRMLHTTELKHFVSKIQSLHFDYIHWAGWFGVVEAA